MKRGSIIAIALSFLIPLFLVESSCFASAYTTEVSLENSISSPSSGVYSKIINVSLTLCSTQDHNNCSSFSYLKPPIAYGESTEIYNGDSIDSNYLVKEHMVRIISGNGTELGLFKCDYDLSNQPAVSAAYVEKLTGLITVSGTMSAKDKGYSITENVSYSDAKYTESTATCVRQQL